MRVDALARLMEYKMANEPGERYKVYFAGFHEFMPVIPIYLPLCNFGFIEW